MGLSDIVSSGVGSIVWDCGIIWLGVGIVRLSNRESDGVGTGSEGNVARNRWGSVLVSDTAFSWHFCFLLTWVLSCCCSHSLSLNKIGVGDDSSLFGVRGSGCWGS